MRTAAPGQTTIDATKWQSVNGLINRLNQWRRNRVNNGLEVVVIEDCLAVCTDQLRWLGFERTVETGNDARRIAPMISLGVLEQVQRALWSPHIDGVGEVDQARLNIAILMEEGKKVNDYAQKVGQL